MLSKFITIIKDDTSGATAIEYALILALIALAVTGAVNAVAGTTIDMWTDVSDRTVKAISG